MNMSIAAHVDNMFGLLPFPGIASKNPTFRKGSTGRLCHVSVSPHPGHPSSQFMNVGIETRVDHLLGPSRSPGIANQGHAIGRWSAGGLSHKVCIIPGVIFPHDEFVNVTVTHAAHIGYLLRTSIRPRIPDQNWGLQFWTTSHACDVSVSPYLILSKRHFMNVVIRCCIGNVCALIEGPHKTRDIAQHMFFPPRGSSAILSTS